MVFQLIEQKTTPKLIFSDLFQQWAWAYGPLTAADRRPMPGDAVGPPPPTAAGP